MIAIAADHQTENVLVGTNSTKMNTNVGLRFISKNVGQRPLEHNCLVGVDNVDDANQDYFESDACLAF